MYKNRTQINIIFFSVIFSFLFIHSLLPQLDALNDDKGTDVILKILDKREQILNQSAQQRVLQQVEGKIHIFIEVSDKDYVENTLKSAGVINYHRYKNLDFFDAVVNRSQFLELNDNHSTLSFFEVINFDIPKIEYKEQNSIQETTIIQSALNTTEYRGQGQVVAIIDNGYNGHPYISQPITNEDGTTKDRIVHQECHATNVVITGSYEVISFCKDVDGDGNGDDSHTTQSEKPTEQCVTPTDENGNSDDCYHGTPVASLISGDFAVPTMFQSGGYTLDTQADQAQIAFYKTSAFYSKR